MNPTLYETKEDLAREAQFMSAIETRFKCKAHKLPIHWGFDLILSRNKLGVAFGEMKCRNAGFGDYYDLIMGRSKLEKYKKYSMHLGGVHGTLPFMVFARFNDGDVWGKFTDFSGMKEEKFRAQNHIDDPLDEEWVVRIPLHDFQGF